MLLLGLEFGGVTYPWNSATVICLIVFGIFTAGIFVLNEWKFAKYPVMPLRLFKKMSNIACLAVCFCHGYVFIAGSYYLPLYFQAVLGSTPLLSGVYLLPFALSLALVSALTGVFIKKTGKYLPAIWFGLVLMTVGFGLFIDLPVQADWAKIILFQIVAGIGVGPNFQAPLIALQSIIHPRDIATATATFGFTRNLSTAISVVIGGVVFSNQMLKKTATLVAGLGPQLANELSGGSAGANVGIVQSLPPAQQAIAREAFFESLQTMWIMVGLISPFTSTGRPQLTVANSSYQYVAFAALGVVASLSIGSHKLSKEHQVTKTGLAEEEARRKEFQEQKRQSKEMLRAKRKSESEEKFAGNAV
jgi:hypothetical protein